MGLLELRNSGFTDLLVSLTRARISFGVAVSSKPVGGVPFIFPVAISSALNSASNAAILLTMTSLL